MWLLLLLLLLLEPWLATLLKPPNDACVWKGLRCLAAPANRRSPVNSDRGRGPVETDGMMACPPLLGL